MILTKLEIYASIKASTRMKEGRGCRKGWLNPARFVILAICVMLIVIFFFLLSLITKCNIKDDDVKVVMAQITITNMVPSSPPVIIGMVTK